MEQDESGAWLMEEGDILDYHQCPGLSPPFQVTKAGSGDYVKLTGFGETDPIVVKARQGSEIRGVFTEGRPDVGEYTSEERAHKRSFVSVVDGEGKKIYLGSWPE